MKIWFFNNYCVLPSQGTTPRHFYFGMNLQKLGHKPVVFVGSHPHNTDIQMINDSKKYLVTSESGFPYVYVKTNNYKGSMIKRVISMLEYYRNGKKAAAHVYKKYGCPDAILGSSAHPLAAVLAIKLARKYGTKSIAEIRDLWPESIVEYGIISKNNPITKILYQLEKWIYSNADATIFTMEGGKDYIIKKEWDAGHGGEVCLENVYHINNGVDLEKFNFDKKNNIFEDDDLNKSSFKVVYTGSIRRVNQVDKLVDVAECLKERNENINILIWGDGDCKEQIEKEIIKRKLDNIKLKGFVDGKYIPYILSKADLNIYVGKTLPLYKYGISMNKLFQYLASGKPILTSFNTSYSIIDKYGCGICLTDFDVEEMANKIVEFSSMDENKYLQYKKLAAEAAEIYDYKRLTTQLISVINDIN